MSAYSEAVTEHEALKSRIAWYVAACAEHGFTDHDVRYLADEGSKLNASLDHLEALARGAEADDA